MALDDVFDHIDSRHNSEQIHNYVEKISVLSKAVYKETIKLLKVFRRYVLQSSKSKFFISKMRRNLTTLQETIADVLCSDVASTRFLSTLKLDTSLQYVRSNKEYFLEKQFLPELKEGLVHCHELIELIDSVVKESMRCIF